MRISVVVVMVSLLIVGLALAQERVQPTFTLNPASGELQAVALGGNTSGGQVDIAVDGQYLSTVSMPDMDIGQTVVLAIIPNAANVQTWSISGAYNYTWGNGGLWEPTQALPDSLPPDVVAGPTVDFTSIAPQALEPVYAPAPVVIPTLNEAGQRLFDKLFGD